MRILWNGHRDLDHPRSGGAERTQHEVALRLVRRGHEVYILSGGWTGSKPIEVRSGINIRRYGKRLLPHLVLPIVIADVSPDIIIDDMAHVVPWGSALISDKPGIVFFRHLHKRTLSGQTGPVSARVLGALEHTYSKTYQRWKFVTETDDSIDDLVKLGVSRSQCVRIPPGVDCARFSPLERSRALTIVYFGGMRDYKRPGHALEVHANLRRRGIDCRLIFVGEGELASTLRRSVISLGLDRSVAFAGRLPYDELVRLLPSCHVNVHCSVAEGWGNSILEAAAAGVPTAAYDVPGVRDTVKDGETGLLVKDGNIEALTGVTLRLLRTSRDWASRCRTFAEGFSWESSVDLWENLLTALQPRMTSGA